MNNQSLPFRFFIDQPSYNTAEVFYARLDVKISKVEALLEAIYYLLWFPGYFGFNWDALYDCLRDFEWIPCYKIVLMHDDLPNLSDSDLKIYLEILRDSVLDWQQGEEHSLEIAFPEFTRARIQTLLTE